MTNPKKRPDQKPNPSEIKIIDDDIGLIDANDENEAMVELIDGLDAPLVVSDWKHQLQPDLKLVKKVDFFSNDKWTSVEVCENEDGDMVIPGSSGSKGLFNKRGIKKEVVTDDDADSDLDMPRIKREPSRNNNDSDSDMDSVPRRPVNVKKEKYSDDDMSPARLQKELEEEVDETKCRVRKKSKMEVLKEDETKRKKEEKLIKYMEWGKGLVQKKQREDKLQSDLYEADKPLARYEGDKDLDILLKQQEREDDPMAEYIRSKGNENADGTQVVAKKSTAKYRGPPAPANRYGLQPGARWDGVDRSNGFEKRWYDSINAKKARDEAAYKWSVEDM